MREPPWLPGRCRSRRQRHARPSSCPRAAIVAPPCGGSAPSPPPASSVPRRGVCWRWLAGRLHLARAPPAPGAAAYCRRLARREHPAPLPAPLWRRVSCEGLDRRATRLLLPAAQQPSPARRGETGSRAHPPPPPSRLPDIDRPTVDGQGSTPLPRPASARRPSTSPPWSGSAPHPPPRPIQWLPATAGSRLVGDTSRRSAVTSA